MKKFLALLILCAMSATAMFGCTGDVNNEIGEEENLPFDGTDSVIPDDESNNDVFESESESSKEEESTSPDNSEENQNKTEDKTEEKTDDTVERPPVGTAVGYSFKDLTLTTLSGESISTADLRGKIIVFNVWATWCPPCKAELPDFDRIAKEYADDVVIIAAHTYDDGSANMPNYVSTYHPNTSIVFAYDKSNNAGYFAAGGYGYVPQTAIIDKDGVIIYTGAGALSYEFLVEIIEANK